jgi:integrase
MVNIGHRLRLGYRRVKSGPGSWVLEAADGRGGELQRRVGVADDYEDADGEHVLDFWQAAGRARQMVRGASGNAPMTWADALTAYETDLRARGGDAYNAGRVRRHLPATLANKPVAMLTAAELRRWRDGLLDRGVTPANLTRMLKAAKASLNSAGDRDPRIANRDAWRVGLKALPDTHRARNVILADDQVRTLIAAAYAEDPALGLLVEVGAVTGGRPSQLERLEVGDLQLDRADGPRLLMPTSRKGRGRKRIGHYPIPIPMALAGKLRQAAGERVASAPLLLRTNGSVWSAASADHRRPFQCAVVRAGLDPSTTYYALRHSSITRALLAGVPVRLVAVAHDTSVAMIEANYSKYIGDHADALLRGALLDTAQAITKNIASLPEQR